MTKDLPMRLDYYQYAAETWQQIFKEIDFSKIHKIIDLCPGWSPKIEMALLKTSFSGKLVFVDKSIKNINNFQELFEPFVCKFMIETDHIDLFKNKKYLSKINHDFDLVVANHIIDDLILDLFFDKHGLRFSDKNFFEKPALMRKTWKEILKDKKIFKEAEVMFKKMLLNIVKPGGYVLITQYLGYQENLYGLEEVYLKCKSLVENTKKNLIKEKIFKEDNILIKKAFLKMSNPYFPKTDITCLCKIV
jgi:hypothetical protein